MTSDAVLEHLMSKYGNTIFRMCYLYLKDYHLAEDAVQETFIKAMKSYDSFLHNADEKTWLIRIAINSCKNILRTRWFKERSTLSGERLLTDTCEPMEDFIKKDSLTHAVMSLKPNERQLIILYYYQELSVKEIAKILHKNENTLYQQLKRTREKLKKILLEDDYGTEII